jgi:hypothetical protein
MIDAFATFPHYRDHIQPIYDALTDPGTFYVPPTRGLGAGPVVIVAGFPDLKRSRHRKHILINHGTGETWGSTDPHYSGGSGRESVLLFICPNQADADLNLERYPDAAAVVANPRLEYLRTLQHGESSKLRVVISFHWDNRTWPQTKSALLYYQPFFDSYAADPRIELAGHAHPRIAARARKYYERAQIPFIADFAEVIRWADVYAVDNSSTLFEAKALGLDVVLLDAPWFPTGDGSLRFDRYVDIGPHAQPETLVEMSLQANYNRVTYSDAGGRMTTEVFGVVEGSTRLAAEAIEEHGHSRTSGRTLPTPTGGVPS